jgi:tetratricopeptide (TPR) repeat protein
MQSIADTFALAQQYHQAGNLSQAEWLCRQVLAADASHGEAADTLGIILAKQGKLEDAVACFRHAIKIQPSSAPYHAHLGEAQYILGRHNEAVSSQRESLRLDPDAVETVCGLGNALFAQGNFDEARECYEQATRLAPGYPEAHNNLGSALERLGHSGEAIEEYQKALQIRPAYVEAWYNLGNVYQHQDQLDDAVRCYQEALRLEPAYALAHNNLATILSARNQFEDALSHCRHALRLWPNYAEAHNNLAIALCGLERYEEALLSCQEALRLRPDDHQTHNTMASAYSGLKKYDEAMRCCREALTLQPDYAEGHNHLGGVILESDGDLTEAAACFREALRHKPGHADALTNLGVVAHRRNKMAESMELLDEALRHQPNLVVAHWNRAMLLLQLGDLDSGWSEYEWRWQKHGFERRNFDQPRWDGSDLKGRTILLYAEQGLGDTLHFIRYAPLVKARGGKVLVECQPAVKGLIAGVKDIDFLVAKGSELPPFDVQSPLLSLPGIFHTTLDTIPAEVPYLHLGEGLTRHWQEDLQRLESDRERPFRIGIAWQGSPTYVHDRKRSLPLASFGPLARLDRVELVSLQKGPGTEQLANLAGQFPVVDLESKMGNESVSFANVAAILKNMDLVISCDTAIVHLAGALAMPVWVALPLVPDWRWLLERQDSPWYPTMRLFRQTEAGRWDDVFERMAVELRSMVR